MHTPATPTVRGDPEGRGDGTRAALLSCGIGFSHEPFCHAGTRLSHG